MTPCSKSGDVVSLFAVTISCDPVTGSVKKYTRSVNVPPTSVAARIVGVPAAGSSAIGYPSS
jgi:hypothetical protein